MFAYTASNQGDDSIDIVHCYSMRNGLYGSPTEARIIWTRLDFSLPDYHRSGHAENVRAVSIPVSTTIEHFATNETDLTVFLMAKDKKE